MTRKLTIKDIAQLAQTSKTTVSFYLNGKFEKMSSETRERIEAVIKETNYRPSALARSLNSKKTGLIGVLVGEIEHPITSQVIAGIEQEARKQGYQVLLGKSQFQVEEEEKILDSMLLQGVEGFIIQPSATLRKYSNLLQQTGGLVFFDSQIFEHRSSWVKSDLYHAVYEAVSQMIDKGYEEFILISSETGRLSTRLEKVAGFVDAVTDKNNTFSEYILADQVFSDDEVEAFLLENLDQDKETLIVVINIWALPHVYRLMKKMEIAFPKTGLIGFENSEWTDFSTPTISTIVHDGIKLGESAAETLISQLRNQNQEPIHRVIECTTQWKESTK
ncbi:TPA: LacI family DNA-binding transcriptional regulator [Streptococcus suis]